VTTESQGLGLTSHPKDFEWEKVQCAIWWNNSYLLIKGSNRWLIKSLCHSSCHWKLRLL